MDALTAYRLVSSDKQTSLERLAARPEVSREVAYYRENISAVKTADDFVDNTRIFNFAMQAYGLSDMAYAKGLVRKMLQEGIDNPDSIANRMTDQRFAELARDFNFTRFKEATTAFDRITKGVVDKYYRQTLETDAGNLNNGARLALYFERKAETLDSPGAILGDAALLKFVQTSYGLPATMSLLPIEKQEKLLNERLDFKELSDPEKIGDLVSRFLLSWDSQNSQSVEVPPLIGNGGATVGLSVDLLTSIQQIRK